MSVFVFRFWSIWSGLSVKVRDSGSGWVLELSELKLGLLLWFFYLIVFLIRGFISRAGVQTDRSETLHALPDRERRPEAAPGAAQVRTHLQFERFEFVQVWRLLLLLFRTLGRTEDVAVRTAKNTFVYMMGWSCNTLPVSMATAASV